MQAQVDLNEDSSALLNLELQIENTKAELNRIMARDASTEFEADDKIVVDRSLTLNEVKTGAATLNTGILIANKNRQIADLTIKEYKSYIFPTVTLFGGYGYLRSASELGFLQSNLSYGPMYGVTISVPLFDGFTTSRDIEIMRLSQNISETQLKQAQNDLNASITTIFNQYLTSINLINLESSNIEAARKNVDVALQRFDLGTITSVELREIQQTQIDAENRLLLEQLNAKFAEVQLKRLSGELL
jgi:outer membrane protein TolC